MPTDELAILCFGGLDFGYHNGSLLGINPLVCKHTPYSWSDLRETNSTQLLWGVQIPMRKKVILLGLFGGSFFVIIAGLIRGIVILTVRSRYHTLSPRQPTIRAELLTFCNRLVQRGLLQVASGQTARPSLLLSSEIFLPPNPSSVHGLPRSV